MAVVKVLTEFWGDPENRTLAGYEKNGGYQGVRKALKMEPAEIGNVVKEAKVRGAGGAGFPAGIKWGFVPKDYTGPRYLCINADESEPGTYKDRYIMERDPHRLIEGAIILCRAVGIETFYIYIRGELVKAAKILEEAVKEAYAKGYLGTDVFGTGKTLHGTVHRGAGAYICGEETGLLNSLEGKTGQPRYKPPFPAVTGLFGKPTIINNVETIANLPAIFVNGAKWFLDLGVSTAGGTKLYPISGLVERPGIYELPLGTSLHDIIYEYGGGIAGGRKLKGVIPGGASCPVLVPEPSEALRKYLHEGLPRMIRGEEKLVRFEGRPEWKRPENPTEIDVPMDYDSVPMIKSMLGTGAAMILDDQTCPVHTALRITMFFHHESCGQCVPCREGTGWMEKLLHRFEHGEGREGDEDKLFAMASRIEGTTICALGDAAAWPVQAFVRKFRHEFEEHRKLGRCPYPEHTVRPSPLYIA
jgi:NADH-quinone oxidoreductase subunit F